MSDSFAAPQSPVRMNTKLLSFAYLLSFISSHTLELRLCRAHTTIISLVSFRSRIRIVTTFLSFVCMQYRQLLDSHINHSCNKKKWLLSSGSNEKPFPKMTHELSENYSEISLILNREAVANRKFNCVLN